jgi:omega-amidase
MNTPRDVNDPEKMSVALGEFDTGWHDPIGSLQRAAELAARAREAGARLLVLPEMFTTGFTMSPTEVVEEENGASAARVVDIARTHRIALIAGLAARNGQGCDTRFHNTAVVVDAEGNLRGRYRKQRLFGITTGSSKEARVYSAGDRPLVVEVNGVRFGIFICFDLRFPELFRAVAREVQALVVIANWPAVRQSHWDTLLRARAIENQSYMIGVNRLGMADGLEYGGGSVLYDPWGVDVIRRTESGLLIGEIDAAVVRRIREDFPVGLG